MATTKISLYRGVSYPTTYQHTDGNGGKVPLTGCQVLFTIKPVSYDDDPTDATATYKVSGTITDGPNGLASWNTLIPATSVEPGDYFFDITVVDSTGKALPPVFIGQCKILSKTANRYA